MKKNIHECKKKIIQEENFIEKLIDQDLKDILQLILKDESIYNCIPQKILSLIYITPYLNSD